MEKLLAGSPQILKIYQSIVGNQSNTLAFFIVVILGMLLVPLPPQLLDIAFVVNFSLSIGIILTTMYVDKPLEFSTFPTILLMVTLFRLALEISATRSILVDGHAGEVIHSVGEFVVGGNFVVGIIIFIILFVVNFIVVTQGAGRVSEVAARFALDSMPGKQLAVDADLNAGLIDEATAKQRRKDISREADFYATMDGGSKFVKGDAIASIIIAVINIVAGFIIGMVQLQLSAGEAASTYTILTIGEGLASQIPALVIAVATGIVVTRSDPDKANLASDIGAQLFARKEVIGAAAITMFILSIGVRGAFLPFFTVAGVLAYWTYSKYQKEKKIQDSLVPGPDGQMITPDELDSLKAQEQVKKKDDNSPEAVIKLLKVDQIELEIGYKLVGLIDRDKGGDLMDRIGQIRRQIMLDMGLPVPAIRVHDNLQVPPNEYQVKLRGAVIAGGMVDPAGYLAVDTGLVDFDAPPLAGTKTTEPSYGLPAVWINNEESEKAEGLGYTVATPSSVIATHLTEIIRKHAHEIMSRQDLNRMMEQLKEVNQNLIDEVNEVLNPGEVLGVVQLLLKEQISIRDLATVFEHLVNYSRTNKDPEFLVERIREGMGRQICSEFLTENVLNALTFHPALEEEMINSLHMGRIALDPSKTKALLEQIQAGFDQITERGLPPVLLCNSKVRLPVRKIVERTMPQFAIISYNEVPTNMDAQSVGMIQVEAVPSVGA